MHSCKYVKSFIAIYMFGFLIGNIYANLFAKDYIISIGIFSEQFFEKYLTTKINESRYMLYLFRIRVVPAIILYMTKFTKAKKITVCLFLIWTGFLCGIVVAASIIQMGFLGSVFALLTTFPHMIFYFATYILLLQNISSKPRKKQNIWQIVVIFLVLCIGIVTECYINPLIIKMFVKTV